MKKFLFILFLLPLFCSAQIDTTMLNLYKYQLEHKQISITQYNRYFAQLIQDAFAGKLSLTDTILQSQVDNLVNDLAGKQDTLPTGTSGQYFLGDHTLGTFPTAVSYFANDAGYSVIPTGTSGQYVKGNLTLGTFPTNVSSFTNDASYSTTTQLNAKADTASHGSVRLAADFTTSSTTAVSTTLSFPIGANENYDVTIVGHVMKATSASGLKLAIAAPSGCTITGTEYRPGASYTTALTNGEISAINTLGGTMATGAGVKVPFRMEFSVTNGSTAGSITLQGATVTSNTMTIYAKTKMTYTKSREL